MCLGTKFHGFAKLVRTFLFAVLLLNGLSKWSHEEFMTLPPYTHIPGASLISQLVKNRLQCRRSWFDSWVEKICWRRDRLPPPVFLGFPCGLAGKESACNVGDPSSIPGLGRSPGEGKAYTLQYSGLENSMNCIVHFIHTVSRILVSTLQVKDQNIISLENLINPREKT